MYCWVDQPHSTVSCSHVWNDNSTHIISVALESAQPDYWLASSLLSYGFPNGITAIGRRYRHGPKPHSSQLDKGISHETHYFRCNWQGWATYRHPSFDQGFEVTAFARSPQKLTQTHENLHLIKGDVLDPAAVKSAIENHDAVLIALGMPLMNKDQLRAKGTANIVNAMQRVGVKRLFCLSGMGANDSHAMLPALYKYLLVPLMMRHLYRDHEMQEGIIRARGLDWTIARPADFDTKRTHSGDYWHGFNPRMRKLKIKISTADVADFMLRQVGNNTYLHKAPCLSY